MNDEVQTHSIITRITHWLTALAIIIMIGSGWRIYNNVPIFDWLDFPDSITLGGIPDVSYPGHNESGTANAIAWHFAGMWLLAASFLIYLLNGVVTGHFWRDFLPVGPQSFFRDFIAALTFRLQHRLGEYNVVQRALYIGVLAAIALMILSGLAIWKPVQLSWLTWCFGGFDTARIVHFFFMSCIVGFIIVHVTLVALVPKTLVAMLFGRATAKPPNALPGGAPGDH
jgi:thiosulfate reductase cytochrome b subunit